MTKRIKRRYSPDDELVLPRAFVHLERMDGGSIWIGLTLPNQETIHVNLFAQKGRLTMLVEELPEGMLP